MASATMLAETGAPRLDYRRRALVFAGAALAWALWRAGIGDDVINGRGWPNLAEFWAAAFNPALGAEFVRLTADAAIVTLAYALLGTALSVVIGSIGALCTSELLWGAHWVRTAAAAILAIPRAIHEVIWALLLVQVFGFDPIVAVLAIGIPFGAVSAKVFAEAIDEADPAGFHQLRATGAGRLAALAYGLLPTAKRDLLAYSFYRFECGVRSAAVLGVVGVGGLGFQLDLSFETLRYEEIWTLIAALMVLSGFIDWWSSKVRRASESDGKTGFRGLGVDRTGVGAVLVGLPVAAIWVGLDPRVMWSERTRGLAVDLTRDLVPPRLGLGGWSELADAMIDTIALSILALLISAVGGLLIAVFAQRRKQHRRTAALSIVGTVLRLGLLLARAVPAPIWAFLAVLVFLPGLWPGAVGLGIYNLGVLGRLFADAFEDQDSAAADQLAATGSAPVTTFLYGSLPTASPRLIALVLYRWEVVVRETVVVGVVGAGGLGVLINEHLVARDFHAVLGAVLALVVLTIAVDRLGIGLRRALR